MLNGYLRLGASICGEPAHDPDFGVADFVALLGLHEANTRYLDRLRSAANTFAPAPSAISSAILATSHKVARKASVASGASMSISLSFFA